MLDLIVANHEISSSFWEVPSCFYHRSVELEEAFCIPFTASCSGSIQGIPPDLGGENVSHS